MDRSTVEQVAHLARIHLEPAEIQSYQEQLAQIMGHFESLQGLDTTGVEPMAYAVPIHNVFRTEGPAVLTREEALANAPDTDGVYFRVPRILAERGGASGG